MRLFTAIQISAGTRAALLELLDQLESAAAFHWSPPENLHVTVKFIGDWPSEESESLRRVLAGITVAGPIDIAIRGVGWYPNPHSPRVLFAGIEAGPALQSLHRLTDDACATIGIPAETKKFNPHLTLARIKSPTGLREVRRRIAQLRSTEFGSFKADAFHLYESFPSAGASQYSKLEEFPLL